MLHGDRLLSANVRVLHHISCDADGEDTPKWAAKAAAEAEAGEPQRQPDLTQAELSPDKPGFFTHDVASGRTPDAAEARESPRQHGAPWRARLVGWSLHYVWHAVPRQAVKERAFKVRSAQGSPAIGLAVLHHMRAAGQAQAATASSSTPMALERGRAPYSVPCRSARERTRGSPLPLGLADAALSSLLAEIMDP